MAPWAEAALFAAARAELVAEVIGPALDRGAWVVCDRFVDSSLAYQGLARGLGLDEVLELNLPAVGGRLPDRTFVLLLDAASASRRAGRARDRIEREGDDFRARVNDAYAELAQRFPERIVVSRRGAAVDEVAGRSRRSRGACRASERGCPRADRREAPAGGGARRGPRTPISSTGRPASASATSRSPSQPSCSAATRAARSAARTRTSTCSSRSATRSASTRSVSCAATCTCGRSRPTGASTSSSRRTR